MEGQNKAELVFIPSPGRGHLLAALEMAKLLVDRDERLSVTVLVIKPFFDPKSSAHSYTTSHQLSQSSPRIRFVDIPQAEPLSNPTSSSPVSFHSGFIESHKKHVSNEVAGIVRDLDSNSKLAGFVVDMFCIAMVDVANEFGVATYVFFTSGAATLGLMFHFQGLIRDDQDQDPTVYKNPDDDISIPSYKFPVPVKLLPAFLFEKDGKQMVMNLARRLRQTKGIIVNTFLELELQAMKSLSEDEKIPAIYSVGPILHLDTEDYRNPKYDGIMKWLDEQPDSSVVFLCFGSKGCFGGIQVKEIALALAKCGHRFLWSLRKPPGENKFETPGEYENPEEVLPEGFIQRIASTGKVIGWAPQVPVLSHRAVGGFVSHCGWNSTLESLWYGVPMAAWPLYAEQQANAFQLVKDLGVAVEIKLEYKKSLTGANLTVTADEIENGIRSLMEPESDIRVKIEALKVKSRMVVVENGSSFEFVGRLIDDVMTNIV